MLIFRELHRYWLFLFLLLNVVSAHSQTTVSDNIDSVKNELKYIEIQDVISESNACKDRIKRTETYLEGLEGISIANKSVDKLKEDVINLEKTTFTRIEEDKSMLTIRELTNSWQSVEEKLVKQESRIQGIIEDLEGERIKLTGDLEVWENTLGLLKAEQTDEQLLDHIKENATGLNLAIERVNDSTKKALAVNKSLSVLKTNVQEISDQISEQESDELIGLLQRDEAPLWSMADSTNGALKENLAVSWKYIREDLKVFVKQNQQKMVLHLILAIALLFLLYYIYSRYSQWPVFENKELETTLHFINKPFFAGSFVALFASFWLYNSMPFSVSELLALLTALPLVFIAPRLVPPRMQQLVYLLMFIYFFDQLGFVFNGATVVKRWILLFQQSVAIAASVVLYFFAKQNFRNQISSGFFKTMAMPISVLVFVLMLVALVLNLLGNTSFSLFLTRGVSFSAIGFFILFMANQLGRGLLTLLFLSKVSRLSNIISRHKDRLLKFSLKVFELGVIILWIRIFLNQFGLLSYIVNYYNWLREYSWVFGNVSITIGHIIDGVLVMVFAWYIGLVLKAIFEDEILPRFTSKRGLPAAVGVSVRYFVISFGFILAVASLGIDLDKLGFIAGALSVGIGFGLQNIVGNFISGLILLFERPVVAGDIVVLGSVEGQVLEIGLRSSKVKTYEGAEVIIPNMDLISKQVTNLTLSDKKRRVEKIIDTEKDANPEQIIEALMKVVQSHQEILVDPKPLVLFKGQFANCYRFRMLYWVTGNILNINSEVALKVNAQFEEIGVRIAIPESKVSVLK